MDPLELEDRPVRVDVASAVRWSAASSYTAQAAQLIISITVARFVLPREYGLLGMATVITGSLMPFQTLGFGAVIVQREALSQRLLSSFFFVTIGLGVLLMSVTLVVSPIAARVYGNDLVAPVLTALSVVFVFSGASVVPVSLLYRRMQFSRLTLLTIITVVSRGIIVISFAAAGWGVWALVIEAIAGHALGCIGALFFAKWVPAIVCDTSEIRKVLSFGLNITAANACLIVSRDADKFLIGAFLGDTALGLYFLAERLLMIPNTAVTQVVVSVLSPLLARIQADDQQICRSVLRALGAIAFVLLPMIVGIVTLARPLVDLALGATWLPGVPVITALAPVAVFVSLNECVRPLMVCKGRADLLLRWNLAFCVARLISILIGTHWGIVGVATSCSVTLSLFTIPALSVPFGLVKGLRLRDLLSVVLPHVLSAAVMGVCVAALRLTLECLGASGTLVTLVCVGCAIGIYVGLAVLTQPVALYDVSSMLPGRWGDFTRSMVTLGKSPCGLAAGVEAPLRDR